MGTVFREKLVSPTIDFIQGNAAIPGRIVGRYVAAIQEFICALIAPKVPAIVPETEVSSHTGNLTLLVRPNDFINTKRCRNMSTPRCENDGKDGHSGSVNGTHSGKPPALC
jgi:hypothetical protein